MPVIHKLALDQTEVQCAIDQSHHIVIPDWEVIELRAIGDRPPSAPTPEWEPCRLMAMGFGDGGGAASSPTADEDEDWQLESLDLHEDFDEGEFEDDLEGEG